MPAYIIYKFEDNEDKGGIMVRGAFFTKGASDSEIFYSSLMGSLFMQISPLTELMIPGKKLSRKLKKAWSKKLERYTKHFVESAKDQVDLPDELRKPLDEAAIGKVTDENFINPQDEI